MPVRLYNATSNGAQRYLWIDETSRMVVEGNSASAKDMLRDCQCNIAVEVEDYQLKSALADTIIAGYKVMDVNDVPKPVLDFLRLDPKMRNQFHSFRQIFNYVRRHG